MKLTHPETGRTVETSKSYEAMYRSQGYVTPAEAKQSTEEPAPKGD